ncbi:MAG: endolytic transglycosylase MltG [bacterium]
MKYINIILIVLLVFFTMLIWPANPFDLSTKKIKIEPGSSAKKIQAVLVSNNILPKFTPFRYVVRLIRVGNSIKAGEYRFSPSDNLFKIIFPLTQGTIIPVENKKVTFPEGTSIYKMGLILKENGFSNWRKFQGLVDQGITAPRRERHWTIFKYIPSESLEGYLFPDTYQFSIESTNEVMIEAMLKRFEEVVLPFWKTSSKETKMTLHEIITLASIVEKEAKKPEERPIIASVFYNRLKKGMPLAADPTIKYALERPSKRVYFDQLEVNSPYNTYKRKGLPPGPICNPGFDSIKAAVYPAKTNYFFFVAKKDGSHTFSKTWGEHQKARGKNK